MELPCKQKHLSSLIAAAMCMCKHYDTYTHTVLVQYVYTVTRKHALINTLVQCLPFLAK